MTHQPTLTATRFPSYYRSTELTGLFERLLRGDSVSMVGIGTVGKTRLVEHFSLYKDVQDYALQNVRQDPRLERLTSKDFLIVNIDPNSIINLEQQFASRNGIPWGWTGYELIFRRLMKKTAELGSDELGAAVSRYYKNSHNREHLGPVMAYPLLEEAVDTILSSSQLGAHGRIVFVFDEFQRIMQLMPYNFFLNLRALRDRFRTRVSYIAVARREVDELVADEDREIMEPFWEIFKNPLFVGPYRTREDINLMYESLAVVRQLPVEVFTPPLRLRLQELCGAHGGLTRTVTFLLNEIADAPTSIDAAKIAIEHGDVQEECHIMLQSFSGDERDVLKQVVQNTSADPTVLNRLKSKFVVLEDNSQLRITPYLLELMLHYIVTGKIKERTPPKPSRLPEFRIGT
jgi:hypothetical protein